VDQKSIAATEFRVETITLSKIELIGLRSLFKKAGLNTTPGQESTHAPEFLNRLDRLAKDAGGEPPLPRRPTTTHLDDIGGRVGNDQLKAIHDCKDQLAQEVADWQKKKESIGQRLGRWQQLKALLAHAADLPVAATVQAEVDAIDRDRRLLDDPDPVPGLVEQLTTALRTALNQAHARCRAINEEGKQSLTGSDLWKRLTPQQQQQLASENHLGGLPGIAVGTTEEVLASLNGTRLKEWKNLADALPTRFSQAQAAAAKLLEPEAQTVKLVGATIKNEADLTAWLEAVAQQIREKLKAGPVII
jgi:hypothetical protein